MDAYFEVFLFFIFNPGSVPRRRVYLWCVAGNGVNFNGVTKGKWSRHQSLSFGAWMELGFEVWFRKGCGLDWCFPSVLEIVAKFPQWKFGSILPFFHGGNLAVLRLRCIIAHKTLFSPSFCCEYIVTEVPNFHSENPVEFRVWCAMVHWQDFMAVYTVRANMLVLGWAKGL